MKYRIYRCFQKGHFILHIINILYFAPKSFFSVLIPSASFIYSWSFSLPFSEGLLSQMSSQWSTAKYKEFCYEIKSVSMFYEVRNLTQPATIFRETSDTEKNNWDRLKTGNINKDSLIRFFSSTDIAFWLVQTSFKRVQLTTN